jgi:hypothetical protein
MMKRMLSLVVLSVGLVLSARSQDVSAKEKAETIAKNEFSKSKHKRVEKEGVVKEKTKVVESTPVINNEASFYQGNYVVQGFDYQLEIRQDPQNQWLVTLKMDNERTLLKNVVITDAYFSAKKVARDGTEEQWEGAFINKNDNGTVDFGLGIKLFKPMRFESINITTLFFKKVSP